MMQNIVRGSEAVSLAIMGMRKNSSADMGAQPTINGRRLPSFEWQLSESLPNAGWKITPKMLSNVIMKPINNGTSVNPPPARATSSP